MSSHTCRKTSGNQRRRTHVPTRGRSFLHVSSIQAFSFAACGAFFSVLLSRAAAITSHDQWEVDLSFAAEDRGAYQSPAATNDEFANRTATASGNIIAGSPRPKSTGWGTPGPNGCDPYEGNWVYDESRPAYDPKTCPFLSDIGKTTNCLNPSRMRTDKNWLHWSWRPYNCAGKGPLRFNAMNFLWKMRNKVVLLVGDSLMYEGFFPAMLCMLHRASPAQQIDSDPRFDGEKTWVVTRFNVTLLHVWSPFLMDASADSKVLKRLKVQNPALGDTAVNLFTPDPSWTRFVRRSHLILLQSATHWPNADKWLRRFFVDRKWQMMDPQPDTFTAYKGAMSQVRRYLDRKPTRKRGKAVAYFLSAPPRLAGCQGSTRPSSPDMVSYLRSKNAQSKIWFSTQSTIYGSNTRVRFVDITHPSLARADAMIGSQGSWSQDCLHPCLPGLPDTWVDLFYGAWQADRAF